MAKVRVKHIYIPKGTTYIYEITYVDERNEPINLTGYKARMQFRETLDNPIILYDATTENGKLVLVTADGIIRLTIPVDENTFDWTEGVYDCEVILPNTDEVFRLVKGIVTIDFDITR